MIYNLIPIINYKMQDIKQLNQAFYNRQIPQFIVKLYSILQKQEYSSVIFWIENGTQLCIIHNKQLQQVILPQFFRHRKLQSFIRQLNMYGFSKISKIRKQKHKFCFKNQYFKRGEIKLLTMIKRRKKISQQKIEGKIQSNTISLNIVQNQYLKANILQLHHQLLNLKNNNPYLTDQLQKLFEITIKIAGEQSLINQLKKQGETTNQQLQKYPSLRFDSMRSLNQNLYL